MTDHFIGIDIGGTKIAAALFDRQFQEITQRVIATPLDYHELLVGCQKLIAEFDAQCGQRPPLGIGIPGAADLETGLVYHAANTPALIGQRLQADMRQLLQREVHVANDADCAALSEALFGAGQGQRSVFGLIMGTGVGGGFIFDGKLAAGAHGLAGEIGHLPLPFRDAADGPAVLCSCGQLGCLDKTISGPALVRLHEQRTGKLATCPMIVELARASDEAAQQTLAQFFVTVAKAFVTIIHTYDPDIIVISGGLNDMPGFYDAVPQLLSRYTIVKRMRVKIVPATQGALSGLRGAALLGR